MRVLLADHSVTEPVAHIAARPGTQKYRSRRIANRPYGEIGLLNQVCRLRVNRIRVWGRRGRIAGSDKATVSPGGDFARYKSRIQRRRYSWAATRRASIQGGDMTANTERHTARRLIISVISPCRGNRSLQQPSFRFEKINVSPSLMSNTPWAPSTSSTSMSSKSALNSLSTREACGRKFQGLQ
jgi:hypothetical protein